MHVFSRGYKAGPNEAVQHRVNKGDSSEKLAKAYAKQLTTRMQGVCVLSQGGSEIGSYADGEFTAA